MRSFLFCVCSWSSLSLLYTDQVSFFTQPHHCRASIRHIERGGIGYEDGYTTFEAFVASDPRRWSIMPFMDIRGHIFNNAKWAANAGFGIRALGKNRIYGVNGYYDYRNTGKLHSNQVGVGFETLGVIGDFRINGYLPFGKKRSNPYDTAFKNFVGHSMIISQKYQSAMRGWDAEFGWHIVKSAFWDFYAAVGPYYFHGKYDPSIWGGKGRVIGTFKNIVSLEISNSYDPIFGNKFQGQISLKIPFGPKTKKRKEAEDTKIVTLYQDRMVQPVGRQEIIVVDQIKRDSVAIDPATGLAYFFVFVNNTSSSSGTYESPYHSLSQAEERSSPYDILYVFPGDGTTRGMDSGILLKPNQKLWGSGIGQWIETSQGAVLIPAQSSRLPALTNTNIDTEGNAITLAANNSIRGFTIASSINDAIYGRDVQTLEVASCIFQENSTFAMEIICTNEAHISVTKNQFLQNVNGCSFSLEKNATLSFIDNQYIGQTSVSNVPIEIAASGNTLSAHIENNLFAYNTTGSIRFNFSDVASAGIRVINNSFIQNTTGAQSTLASNLVVILPDATTTNYSSFTIKGNRFLNNSSNAIYFHPSGLLRSLGATVEENIISNNGGSALVCGTPCESLTLSVTGNSIEGLHDNAIAVIASGTTSTGTITLNNNNITNIGNSSNGIAVNQDFSTLNLYISSNRIDGCEGTGILSYAPTGIDNLFLHIEDNSINNCQNMSSNAASAIDMEQYKNLLGFVTNNSCLDNLGTGVVIGSTLSAPSVCLTLTGNSSNADFRLDNPIDGLFNLSPCNVNAVNSGTIYTSGDISLVQSCSNPTPCNSTTTCRCK